MKEKTFAMLLQNYFCQRLVLQRNASGETIANYRDTFRLLLTFVQIKLKKPPTELTFSDLSAEVVLGFLDHIEKHRHNKARSRNTRLAAIRSFMHYAALFVPSATADINRVLAIPCKRFEQPVMDFLSTEEIQSVLSSCCSTWSGKRDYVMFSTLYNTGARVSEIIKLKVLDVTFDHTPYVNIHGKGRKMRTVPIWKSTANKMKEWLLHNGLKNDDPVFPNRQGKQLTRYGVVNRLQGTVDKAAQFCLSLKKRRISPHTLRHTTAMHLLQSGVDITVIALWLGHESPATTHKYVEADLSMKVSALNKLHDVSTGNLRFQPKDSLIDFLEKL